MYTAEDTFPPGVYICVRNLDTLKIVADSKEFIKWFFVRNNRTPQYWPHPIPASDVGCDGPEQLKYRMLVTLVIRV